MAMEEILLYDGKVELRFDPNRHVYRVDGKWIPGCTSISGFMDNGKSEALKRWALKMGLNYLATQIEAGKSYDEIELAEMFESARKEPFKRTKKAADIGSVTHDYAEKYIKHQLKLGPKPKLPVNKMAKTAAEGFVSWAKGVDEWLYAERKIVSLDEWYAGTVDIVAIIGGKLTVADLKTSNYLSAEHLIQLAGYQIALEEEFEDKFENRMVLHLDKEVAEIKVYDLGALEGSTVQITPWTKIRFNSWESDKAAFLGLRQAFRTVRGG